MQKNGAGLHTASSCFWDNQTDGSCAPPSASLSPLALPEADGFSPPLCSRWRGFRAAVFRGTVRSLNPRALVLSRRRFCLSAGTVRTEYKTMYCIVTVFGLGI